MDTGEGQSLPAQGWAEPLAADQEGVKNRF